MFKDYNERELIAHQSRTFKDAHGYDPYDGPVRPEDELEDDMEWWDEDEDRREDK